VNKDEYKCFDGRKISQAIVPVRDRVLKMAHDTVMNGRQGQGRKKPEIEFGKNFGGQD